MPQQNPWERDYGPVLRGMEGMGPEPKVILGPRADTAPVAPKANPWERDYAQAAAPMKHPMPEPPGAPKIAVEPVPVPPGFGQRVYGQTLGPAVELAKSLKADPAGTIQQTAANLFGVSQYQTILKQLRTGQYLPAAISILSFKNPPQMQAEAMTTPFIEDVRTGNWGGATGNVVGGAITLAGPKILSKVPGAARVTGAGVRAAAPDVAGGVLKVGTGALIEHMLPGPSPLKYAFEGYTGYSGARQIGRGLRKGVAATRQSLRDRATAAAEALAKERAAAPGGAQPVPAGALRALPEPATRMPPGADTSFVRGVPGEYAARDPLPPSRQLAAPGRPAIITPAPDPLAGDTSGVRAVPAEVAEVIPEPLRKNPAAATAAEQLRDELIKNGTITPEDVRATTKKSGAEKIVENRNAKAERFTEQFKRFKFSTRDVKDFGETEWKTFADALGEDVPSADTIEQILFQMRKRK